LVWACDSPKNAEKNIPTQDSLPKVEQGKFDTTVRVAWNSETKMEKEIPLSKLLIRITQNQNAAEVVVGTASGTFSEIERNEYQKYQIPADALAACSAFWGGLQKIFFAKRTPDDQIEVQVGYLDESVEEVSFEEKEKFLVTYSSVKAELEKVEN